MAPELYWIRDVAPLRLAQMARPRSGDWLSDEITGWHRAGINTVVSLLESQEVQELELRDEASLCASLGIEFLQFPIADRGTPHSLPATLAIADDLVKRLRHEEGIGIHCRAGIGRSGLISACVLLRLGVPFADVFPILTRARKVIVPDTAAQVEWVRNFGLFTSQYSLQR